MINVYYFSLALCKKSYPLFFKKQNNEKPKLFRLRIWYYSELHLFPFIQKNIVYLHHIKTIFLLPKNIFFTDPCNPCGSGFMVWSSVWAHNGLCAAVPALRAAPQDLYICIPSIYLYWDENRLFLLKLMYCILFLKYYEFLFNNGKT